MWTGLRYAYRTPAIRTVLLRAAAFVVFGSALWALLPVVARFELGAGPTAYGLLIGCFGAGAVIGAILLSHMRPRLNTETVIAFAIALFAAMQLALAWTRDLALAGTEMVLAGAAWLSVLSSLNASVQLTVSSWIRGRAMSLYLLVFFGGTAAGSTLWGKVASEASVYTALTTAALGLLSGLTLTARYRLPAATE
jgi:predicted MFS family arabinose efflux permease